MNQKLVLLFNMNYLEDSSNQEKIITILEKLVEMLTTCPPKDA